MLAALEEVIAAFPVYRTYVSARGQSPDATYTFKHALVQDAALLDTAERTDIEHAVIFQVECWSTQRAATERGALYSAMLKKQKERNAKRKKPLGDVQLKRAAANKIRWGL